MSMGPFAPAGEAVRGVGYSSDRIGFVTGTSAPSNPSDEALMAGMAIGDEHAAFTFVRRYQRRVFGLAVGLLDDRGVAEDVAQEALLRAWRHAPVFDARRGTVTSWVLTITRNLAIDAIRQRRALPTDPDDLVELDDDTARAVSSITKDKDGFTVTFWSKLKALALLMMCIRYNGEPLPRPETRMQVNFLTPGHEDMETNNER